jgi:hypothetical protein
LPIPREDPVTSAFRPFRSIARPSRRHSQQENPA